MDNKGSVTIQAAIMATIFLFMFIATYKNVLLSNNFNEVQRRAQMVSQNKLMTYDKFLFNHFGILAYFGDDFQGLWSDQRIKSKWSAINARVVKLKPLSLEDEFEKQVKKLVKARIPYEIISIKNMQVEKDDKGNDPGGNVNFSYIGAAITGSDKLNIAEYVVSTMSDRVESNGRETSLFNVEEEHPYMFGSQVEYIITGNKSLKGAHRGVYLRIFGIREIINTKYIMSDEKDMAIIRAEALAAVAASEGAIPYEIAEKAAIAAMATARSTTDLSFLLKGEYISAVGSPREGHIKKVYYDDFLRLLLLSVEDKDLKHRIFHVIEGNAYEKFGAKINLEEAYVGHVFSLYNGEKEVARGEGEYFEEEK